MGFAPESAPLQSYVTKQTLRLSEPHFPMCKMKMVTSQLGFYEDKREQAECLPQSQAHSGPPCTFMSLIPVSSGPACHNP